LLAVCSPRPSNKHEKENAMAKKAKKVEKKAPKKMMK
jgi:hypothetical protein